MLICLLSLLSRLSHWSERLWCERILSVQCSFHLITLYEAFASVVKGNWNVLVTMPLVIRLHLKPTRDRFICLDHYGPLQQKCCLFPVLVLGER
jgi:hypothetical protein